MSVTLGEALLPVNWIGILSSDYVVVPAASTMLTNRYSESYCSVTSVLVG
jgi:hypothetical protein